MFSQFVSHVSSTNENPLLNNYIWNNFSLLFPNLTLVAYESQNQDEILKEKSIHKQRLDLY